MRWGVRAPFTAGALVLLAVGLAPAERVAAQAPRTLAVDCLEAGGDPALCHSAALAAEAVVGQIGVAAGWGSEVTGTATTLGRRLGTSPRIAPAFRAGVVRASTPDLDDAGGLGERAYWLAALQGSVTTGVFDGFRLMPTVGGFLSLDAFAQAAWVLLPAREGFEGRVAAFTLGARVGILREGFTLPGVSVSVARRWVGDALLGDRAGGGPAEVAVDPSVTSIRATVGKDLFAMEILGGVGWDDYAADATWRVAGASGGTVTGSGALDATRRLYFVGASTTFNIVFALSVEGGVAQGFDPVEGWGGAYDPAASRIFGSLGLRLTI